MGQAQVKSPTNNLEKTQKDNSKGWDSFSGLRKRGRELVSTNVI